VCAPLFSSFDSLLISSFDCHCSGLLTGKAALGRFPFDFSQPYVVYLGGHSHGRAGAAAASSRARARRSHVELLGAVLRSEARARGAIFYSYTRYINGFAATLDEGEAAELSSTSRAAGRGRLLHLPLSLPLSAVGCGMISPWHCSRLSSDDDPHPPRLISWEMI